jgi:transcription elongation GreA/GreB family factor
MNKFKTVERRISGNAEATKFRVQYKKNGKPRANIFTDIVDARRLRDETDTAETKAAIKKGTMNNDAPKELYSVTSINLSPDSSEKKLILSKYLEALDKKIEVLAEMLKL